jgi:DNA-binding CsgD family transcriptional regulator
VHRDVRGARTDGVALTEREEVVLRLVAEGSPTRRIAGQLGVSAETVETHIKTAMRKLGARTRTEAAARAAAHWAAGPRAAESGAAGTATADSAAPRSAPGGSAVGSAARGSTAAAPPARRAAREDR